MKLSMVLDTAGVGVFRREAEITVVHQGDLFRVIVERDKDSGQWSVRTYLIVDDEQTHISGGSFVSDLTLHDVVHDTLIDIFDRKRDIVDFDLGEG